MTSGKRRLLAAAILLALPFAAEGIVRAALFVAQRSSAPPAASFTLIGVGESTMNGFPFEPHISIPALVNVMFDGRIGERDIVVRNLARDGHPIYAQSVLLAQAVAYRDPETPGAVLIYAGHNEGDLRRANDEWRPGLFEAVARHSFVARAVQLELVSRRIIKRPRNLDAYEYHLRRTIETAKAAGLLPVLSTVSGNIAGVEPNLETSDADAARVAMAVVERQLKQGDCAAIEGRCTAATAANDALAALLCYQGGKCRQAAGDIREAEELYQKAVDLDPRTVFGRATRAQNAVVRRLAAEYEIPIIDAAKLLALESPSGLPGNEMFGDGQHPNLRGMVMIAGAYAEAIAQAFSVPVPQRELTADEAAVELGLGPNARARAHVLSASWLIASAANHPWPYDRLGLAETHLRAALDIAPDDFTAWFDMAVVAAARNGLLRQPEMLEKLGEWSVFYRPAACVPDEELEPMIERLRAFRVDEKILSAVLASRDGACAGFGDG